MLVSPEFLLQKLSIAGLRIISQKRLEAHRHGVRSLHILAQIVSFIDRTLTNQELVSGKIPDSLF